MPYPEIGVWIQSLSGGDEGGIWTKLIYVNSVASDKWQSFYFQAVPQTKF